MKTIHFFIGLFIVMLCMSFRGCDTASIGEGLDNIGTELQSPTKDRNPGYVHRPQTRNAGIKTCSTNNPHQVPTTKLAITVNGRTKTYSDGSYNLRGVSRDDEITLRAVVTGSRLRGMQIQTIGAPLAGGKILEPQYTNKFTNSQVFHSNQKICTIDLREKVYKSLTKTRETTILVSTGSGDYLENAVRVVVYYND